MTTEALGTCAGCVFYHPYPAGGGECRRSAPRIHFTRNDPDEDYRRIWPPVDPSDWCGEYREDRKLALTLEKAA